MNREPVSRRSGVSSEDVAAAAVSGEDVAAVARQPGHAREPVSLLQAADRLWAGAWELDEIRGDSAASLWAATKIRELMRAGLADDVQAVLPLARALEDRLAQDRPAAAAAR